MVEVEVRCPVGFRRLFMKLKIDGGSPAITSQNLMEFSCAECTKSVRKTHPDVIRVLHRYDMLGTFIETEWI